MKWKKALQCTTARLYELSKRVDKLESKPKIDVQIRHGEVFIDAPRGTRVNLNCWYDDCNKMNEYIEMGTDEMAGLIMIRDELEARIKVLEKK